MAVNVISCGLASLPRSLDVSISVSKPQAEQTTDLSIPVMVQASGSFDHGASRIGYYASLDAVNGDARVSAEGKKAAQAFFGRSDRPDLLAIAQAFSTPQRGYLRTGALGAVAAFTPITNGSFAVSIDGVSEDITGLNFSTATTLANVATIIQTALNTAVAGTTAVIESGTLRINSPTTGDSSAISVLAPVSPASGTDISGPGFLNGLAGVAVTTPGYTPGDLVDELALIAEAARCSGRFVYGYVLDAVYRDSPDQLAAVEWAQARTSFMPLVSNSPLAWDPASTNDIGPEVQSRGIYRTAPQYHDNPNYYPDMSLIAGMLAVDYRAANSTRTAKFMDLPGIPTVPLTESQWLTLESKGYNAFTLTGNTSRVTREGTTGNAAWYIDDVINLDNFVEDLQVALYNVFLRNKKVPYNVTGQTMLRDASTSICERYVFNGTLSERPVQDQTATNGVRVDPAYQIVDTPLELMTVADRAGRIGPPQTINLNLAGAIHSIAVTVNAYS